MLNSTFAQDLRVEMLNFENVANLLPHTMLLVNSKYENHIMGGLNLIKYTKALCSSNKIVEKVTCKQSC